MSFDRTPEEREELINAVITRFKSKECDEKELRRTLGFLGVSATAIDKTVQEFSK